MEDDELRGGLNDTQFAPIASLDEPTRRRLYQYVSGCADPVTRDQASAALGLDRSLAAYHLDRLVDEGLLAASFARPEGRGGPGAGRPAKHYRRADREFSVNLPPRDYRLLAELLARAVESDVSNTIRTALSRAAADFGRGLAPAGSGDDNDALVRHLAGLGFEPYEDDGVIRLRNCPFHQLAREHTELVCGMNLELLSGLVGGLALEVTPRLDPAPGRCCVAFGPRRPGPVAAPDPKSEA